MNNIQIIRHARLAPLLAALSVATGLGITGLALARSFLVPNLTIGESRLINITLGFIACAAMALAYFLTRKLKAQARNLQIENFAAESIVRNAAEGILTMNKRGLILSLNPAAEKYFGYHAAEVLDHPITQLLAEPPQSERPNLIRDTMALGTMLGLATGAREVIGKRKNGETFPLELTGGTMTVNGESVSIAFARDISKRKRAQRYLTAHYAATCILAEARSLPDAMPRILQSICEALSWEAGAYWRVDAEAGSLRCDEVYQSPLVALPVLPATASLTCMPGQGLAGRVWSTGKPVWFEDIRGIDDSPWLAMMAPLQLLGGFAFPIYCGKDMCAVLTFFSARKQKRDEQLLDIMGEFAKQLNHFIARKRDEEELQHSEEALRKTTQTLEALVQAAPVAINIIDLEGKVLLWNPTAERMFGWTKAEVLGHPLPLFRDDGRGDSGVSLAPNLTDPSHHGQAIRCRRKDGATITVSLSAAPLSNASGNIFGSVSILLDLTEQQKLEDQLRQAQKMEAVGQLAGGVAHDFNNLLTIITGYTDLLLMTPNGPDKTKRFLEQIHKAGEQAAALTRQLLAFGRKQIIQAKVLDLNSIVKELGKMLCRLIGEDIEIVYSLDPELGHVKADPGQIEQILMNLAANARDAMPDGGKLTIATVNFDPAKPGAHIPVEMDSGQCVLLTVSDTGCGMDAATMARVFEPFFTTKEMGKGTGLGLATAYGIVKQNNGHIEVESAPDRGSTFRVYLPLFEVPDSPVGKSHKPVQVPSGKETVLLVEDENEVRKLIDQALQQSGYKVLAASTGQEALSLCEKHREEIDILVTDVIMPKMNGRQLAEQAISFQKNLKVLYMSGYTDKILDGQGVLGPRAEFLQKPISPRALALKVREILDSPI